jgi:hypothetical protein
VRDDGGADNAGTATTVNCTNVSGQTVSVRFVVFDDIGTKKTDITVHNLLNTQVLTASTHRTVFFANETTFATGSLAQGTIDVEATNAAVFCTASVEQADIGTPSGWDLHVVRVNAAPGTVE